MSCKKITRKHRQVCIGSLDTVITLKDRAITAPVEDEVDYTETFTENAIVWANIQTTDRGEIIFDRTNEARVVSHLIYIRYLTGVTAETWVEWENINYDILSSEDLEERHDFLLLKCAKRGDKTLPINQQ
jgi:SPP1 family predicted phage head-tail adaptor